MRCFLLLFFIFFLSGCGKEVVSVSSCEDRNGYGYAGVDVDEGGYLTGYWCIFRIGETCDKIKKGAKIKIIGQDFFAKKCKLVNF